MSDKMKLFFFRTPLVFALAACSPDVSYYKYNNIVVTRYNYFDSVVFCYGKHPVRPNNRRNQILSFWPSTRVMSAYLVFNKNNKVDMYTTSGLSKEIDPHSDSISLPMIENYYFDSLINDKNNVFNKIYVNILPDVEDRVNRRSQTKVIVVR